MEGKDEVRQLDGCEIIRPDDGLRADQHKSDQQTPDRVNKRRQSEEKYATDQEQKPNTFKDVSIIADLDTSRPLQAEYLHHRVPSCPLDNTRNVRPLRRSEQLDNPASKTAESIQYVKWVPGSP